MPSSPSRQERSRLGSPFVSPSPKRPVLLNVDYLQTTKLQPQSGVSTTCPFLPRTVVSDRRLALKDQERVFGRFSSQHKPSHRSHELLRPVFQLCTCPAIRNRWEHDPGDGESSTSRSGSLLRLDSTSHTPAMPSSPLLMVTSEGGAPAEVAEVAEVAEPSMIHENASPG